MKLLLRLRRCLPLLALVLFAPWAAAHGPGQEAAQTHDHDGNKQAAPGQAVAPDEWLREQTGQYVPLDAEFRNERGESVTLGQLIDRPTLLLPVYYTCPKVCSFDQANLANGVRRSSRPAGSYRIISLSFNADETPEAAALVKPNYLQLLPQGFAPEHWTFLTGDSRNIRAVTRAIGFTFKKRDDLTFIHPTTLVVLDKDGRIIKYVYGSFITGDIDLALAEAAQGTPAASIRRLIAFCLPDDPRQRQQVFLVLRIGAALILGIGCLFFLRFLRAGNKPSQPSTPP